MSQSQKKHALRYGILNSSIALLIGFLLYFLTLGRLPQLNFDGVLYIVIVSAVTFLVSYFSWRINIAINYYLNAALRGLVVGLLSIHFVFILILVRVSYNHSNKVNDVNRDLLYLFKFGLNHLYDDVLKLSVGLVPIAVIVSLVYAYFVRKSN